METLKSIAVRNGINYSTLKSRIRYGFSITDSLRIPVRSPHVDSHQFSRSVEYKIWIDMKARCLNPRHGSYSDYGGRGITVCPEWTNDFQPFLDHIGRRPTSRHSLDRIDNSRGYEPGNVKWSTRREQALNTRANHLVTFNGVRKPLLLWAEQVGLLPACLYHRLHVGWPMMIALYQPPLRSRAIEAVDGPTPKEPARPAEA
jgi:hypothetical protein